MGKITSKDWCTFPGDRFIPTPRKTITHSITINASSEMIWPWLIQMGAGRAGWYSYDKIDNGGKPSARQIISELQHAEAGDIMPAIPNAKDAFIVRDVHPGKYIILVVPIQGANEDPDARRRMLGPLRVSWALVLQTISDERTRLISRSRVSADWLTKSGNEFATTKRQIFIERIYGLFARMPWFLMAPIALTGHFFMESRMLHGIKRRVLKASCRMNKL